MKRLNSILLLILLFIFTNYTLNSCTTAIISGKYTVDGRPLLLKHRDSDYQQNKLVFFSDGKYKYIGLINSEDKFGKEVWGGSNSAGFAIMNSASYNLKGNDTTKLADREGEIIKLALQTCATVDDFENLLKTHLKPLGVEANFGVIDAFGNGAYFETNNFTYTKFDVNDPKIAPNGYIVRTNFSFSGEKDKGAGHIRFATASKLFEDASKNNDLSLEFLLKKVSRSLSHSLLNKDFSQLMPENSRESQYIHFEDFIPRYSSTSSVIVQGVKTGESADYTTIWTVLGFPLCSVAFPTWIAGDNNLPSILNTPGLENAPLCSSSLELKKELFSYQRDGFKKYLNLPILINKENNGILQNLQEIEKKILEETRIKMYDWHKNGITQVKVRDFYAYIEGFVKKEYRRLFNIEM